MTTDDSIVGSEVIDTAGLGPAEVGGAEAARVTRENVARYYDRNTMRFLLMGGRGGGYAMHRELWAPGVRSAREATAHVNRLLADELALAEPMHPLCRPDCPGLCAACGGRLDEGDHEGHLAPEMDPRLAALADWKPPRD